MYVIDNVQCLYTEYMKHYIVPYSLTRMGRLHPVKILALAGLIDQVLGPNSSGDNSWFCNPLPVAGILLPPDVI